MGRDDHCVGKSASGRFAMSLPGRNLRLYWTRPILWGGTILRRHKWFGTICLEAKKLTTSLFPIPCNNEQAAPFPSQRSDSWGDILVEKLLAMQSNEQAPTVTLKPETRNPRPSAEIGPRATHAWRRRGATARTPEPETRNPKPDS